jgi:hypothetical protein
MSIERDATWRLRCKTTDWGRLVPSSVRSVTLMDARPAPGNYSPRLAPRDDYEQSAAA